MSISNGAAGASQRTRMRVPWADRLAIGASFACLAHCLGLPMLIAASPGLARLLDVPEAFHLYAFLGAIPISALAMTRGFRRHGLWLPMGVGVAGLSLLGVGALAGLPGIYETGLTVSGSLVLATAHVRNWQLRATRHKRSSLVVPAPTLLLTRTTIRGNSR